VPSNDSLGVADPISYVKLSKALKVVSKKLNCYENYIVERVKNILKSKKKIKFGEAFIDKYFVLKLLLEVYGLEKGKSERVFESSFSCKMKKSFVTFGDFHHFMVKNFSYLNSVQIAELYRETYLMSSGHVTYRAIHYICGIKGLFIPLLIAKRTQSGNDKTINGDMLLLDMQNNLSKMSQHFEQAGLEQFTRIEPSLNNFLRQTDWYRNNKTAFYERLLHEKMKIVIANAYLDLRSSFEIDNSEKMDDEELQSQLIHLHSLLHQTDKQVLCLSKQKEKRNKSLKMLVRNFKIRIQESIL